MAKAEYKSAIRSRKMICNALADLILEKPIEKITVTDVVTRADINRGTFYAHYTDIQDVMDSIFKDAFRTISDTIETQAEAKNTPTAPPDLLHKIQEFFEENQSLYERILSSSYAISFLEQGRQLFLDTMLKYQGIYKNASSEEYEFLLRFCSGAIMNLYRDYFSHKLDMTFDELTERLGTLCSRVMG